MAQLREREQENLLRRKPTCTISGSHVVIDGKRFLNFASNDYLGLANHPHVNVATQSAISKYGVGGGASHMVSGHHPEHQILEDELAIFTNRERALVFSSGYMANLAVASTLVGRGDVVLQDRLNHASLIDGGLLSGARFQRYLHNDSDSLDKYLTKFSSADLGRDAEKTHTSLVVTDGVFSMDGDIADLKSLSKVCLKHHALLMVDDAHGFGVLGTSGAGSIEDAAMSPDEVPVLIGTFGKAFGTAGAFVAGSKVLIDYIEQFARPYIYTTSMPPMLAAATRASLSLIRESDSLREKLHQNIRTFKGLAESEGIDLMSSDTAIQPVLIGSNEDTMRVAASLKNEGFLVGAIRPPTVPNKQARLRVTISAIHDEESIESLVKSISLHLSQIDSGTMSRRSGDW